MGGFQTVPHFALGRGNRRLPRDHLIADCCQRIHVGVAAAELGSRVLFRRGIAGIELAFQLTAAGAQSQRAVAGQPGGAVDGQQNVIRADAAMDQAGFVQQRHTLHHRLQQGAGLGGGQCAAAQAEIMRQGHALFAFLHSVDGVVFLHHVQDGVQAGGRGEVMQIVVQVLKVHPAGLEQHFFPLFGHQRALGAAAVAKGNGEILFDEDELLLLVQNAAVSQAITVGAQIGADGVPARQLGAQRQGALRVAVLQRAPAVGAVSLVTAPQGLQAVWAKRFRHEVASFSA